MNLIDYWPTAKHLNECVRPEAENPAEAVFMAEHQPMRFKRRAYGQVDDIRDCNEGDVLAAFLESDLPRGTLLLPIEGDSGSGKSHVIRWLGIQLRRRPDRETRHVIQIPKSSSLKRVLFLIMERLSGPKYDRIRDQLTKAREQLDEIQAVERVRAGLLAEVRTRALHADERIKHARQRGEQPDLKDQQWKAHGADDRLPALLKDPTTEKLFLGREGSGIIDLIAKRLTQDVGSVETVRQQFTLQDFQVPSTVDISQAGMPAMRYLKTLEANNHAKAHEAISLLNEVLSAAIAPIANPTDASLTEIFVDIREQLLKDGRELVLLIEDFAAMRGIDGAMLDAMNREGIREGKQELCVMRTAIAVTRGYLSNRETVRTRAVYAWELEDTPFAENQTALDAIVRLVGGYLNAARFGQERLNEMFDKRDPADPRWQPRFDISESLEPQDRSALTAFGESEPGISLFPFNREMIVEVATKRFTQDGRIRFNPRDVINHIVRKVLGDYRSAFERGAFPPSDFMDSNPNEVDAALRSGIRSLYPAAGLADRYSILVRYWGGNPERLTDLHIEQGIYRAFSLEPLDVGSKGGKPAKKGPSEVQPVRAPQSSSGSGGTRTVTSLDSGSEVLESQPVPEDASPEEKDAKEWSVVFDQWTLGTRLPQKRANKLREWITEDVLAAIDWDRELLKPTTVSHTFVLIPRSEGTGGVTTETAFVEICSDEVLEDADQLASVVLALRGLTRFHIFKSFNYADAEIEFANYANLVEALARQAVAYFRKRYDKFEGDTVSAITQTLLLGSRILNCEHAFAADFASQIDAVLAEAVPQEAVDGTTKWDECRRECRKNRALLREVLLRQIAARQGGANLIHAVDAARLISSIREFVRESKIVATVDAGKCDEDIKPVSHHISELRRKSEAAIKERQESLQRWSRDFRTWLGSDFEKSAVVTLLQDTVTVAANIVLHPAVRDKLLALIQSFREAAVTECLQYCDKLSSETSPLAALSSVARIDDRIIATCNAVKDGFESFFKEKIQYLRGELAIKSEESSQQSIEYVDTMLTHIVTHVDGLLESSQQS